VRLLRVARSAGCYPPTVRRSVRWLAWAWLLLAVTLTLACRTTAAAPAAEAPSADRERMAAAAWASGQLSAHFSKHGQEGPYRSAAEYDAAARETIRSGTMFSYVDRESDAERVGFYDKANNRFTSVTRDGARITTHFRPTRGEAYVRGLERSTYR
jgi:pyocin large subunit-like protein